MSDSHNLQKKTAITIQKTTSIIILKATIIIFFHFLADYNSAFTGSKHNFDTATERTAKNDNNTIIDSNQKSKINEDNNSLSNNNRCTNSEDNNDNNKDGNFISASTPTPSDSNADNALLEEITRIM